VKNDSVVTVQQRHVDLRLLGMAAALVARYHARANGESGEHAEEDALEQLLEGMAMGAELPLDDDVRVTVHAPAARALPRNNHNRRS
jgi:hypothetical protein